MLSAERKGKENAERDISWEQKSWLRPGGTRGLLLVKSDGMGRGESLDREDGWSEENDKRIHSDVLPGKLFSAGSRGQTLPRNVVI